MENSLKPTWKEIAETIAIASIVVSLLFVGYELRQSRSIALFEGAIAVEEAEHNLRSLQLEYIDIWHKGCLGDELSPNEKGIFNRIVAAVNFRGFSSWTRANQGFLNEEPIFFSRKVAQSRFQFPGFNESWVEIAGFDRDSNNSSFNRGSWGSWLTDVNSNYASLIDANTNRTADVSNCG